MAFKNARQPVEDTLAGTAQWSDAARPEGAAR
jgi:hypothetical protein